MSASASRRWLGALFALGAMLPAIESGAADDIDCKEIDIGLESYAAINMTCYSDHSRSGEGSSTWESLYAFDRQSLIFAAHAQAGIRTCLTAQEPKELAVGTGVFVSTTAWGDTFKSERFKVRRFEGTLESGEAQHCFAFSRPSDKVSRCVGFRHMLYGFYCDAGTSPIAESRVDEVLGDIRRDYE